jgi:hypothetical protein
MDEADKAPILPAAAFHDNFAAGNHTIAIGFTQAPSASNLAGECIYRR